jgi:metallophosphoesterase superfamily enzyme
MPRGFGLASRSVHKQSQRHEPPTDPEPLPEPYAPAAVEPAHLGIEDSGDGISFFVLGDVGGIKHPGPQNAVSVAMQKLLEEGHAAAFVLIVGDVVYYNGQQMATVEGRQTGYLDQFYEAYGHLAKPIIAFPGNHDGEREDPTQPTPASLQGFMENFCTEQPEIPVDDPHLEYGRHTQTLPYCEWTLNLQAATVVAVYTNVPSHGHLEPQQEERLVNELRNADPSKKLIVGLHHPPYSIDSHHGESKRMQEMLDKVFDESGRTPDLILSGHVHDYQRFARAVGGDQVPYIVSGNGGYPNLHKLAKDAEKGEEVLSGVTFEYGDDSRYGFLKLTIKGGVGEGEYFAVEPGEMPDGSEMRLYRAEDKFTF